MATDKQNLPQLEFDREIRQLYHERNTKSFQTPAGKRQRSWPEFFILLVVASITSVATAATVVSLLQPTSTLIQATVHSAAVATPELNDELVGRLAGSVGLVFAARTSTASNPAERTYLVSEAMGHALVLSGDGWLVTTQAVVVDPHKSLVVAVGGQIRPVTAVVLDPVAPLAFLKVTATNLTPTPFADYTNLKLGQPLAVVAQVSQSSSHSWYLRRLASLEARPPAARADLVVSSEQLPDRYLLDADLPPGSQAAPVLTTTGEVVGLVADYGGAWRAVVPLDSLGSIMDTLFNDGVVYRPVLGVSYLQAAWVSPYLESGGPSGALITSSAKHAAVVPQGPAALAGIKEGDAIVAVAGEHLLGRSLTAVLQQFRPGTKVDITFVRAGKEHTVSVTLGQVPTTPKH